MIKEALCDGGYTYITGVKEVLRCEQELRTDTLQ